MKTALNDALLRSAKNNSDAAIAKILVEEMPIIRYYASLAICPGLDFDDAVQEGLIGLFGAIKSFEIGKKASFQTYASICIKNSIISAQRSAGRKKHSPLNYSVPLQEEQSVPGPEELTINNELIFNTLQKIDTLLTPLEKKVLALYIEGFSYKDIASRLNKNSKAVENALQRIRRKLK